MTCKNCDNVQENLETEPQCFVRIGPANILIVGCPLHTRATITLIQEALAARKYENADLFPPTRQN